MSELRHDPLSKRWVIIANRAEPSPWRTSDGGDCHARGGFCPFCPGSEDKTPAEIVAIRPAAGLANGPGGRCGSSPTSTPRCRSKGRSTARGRACTTGCEASARTRSSSSRRSTPCTWGTWPRASWKASSRSARTRMRDLGRDQRFKYVLLFKNHGAAAGATLSHPHLQLIATPVTPRAISVELDSAREHFHLKERCIFCDMLEQELQSARPRRHAWTSTSRFSPRTRRASLRADDPAATAQPRLHRRVAPRHRGARRGRSRRRWLD